MDEEKLRLKEMLSRFEREKQLEAESSLLRLKIFFKNIFIIIFRYQVLEKDLKTAQKDCERCEENLRLEKEKNQKLSNQSAEVQNDFEQLQKEKRQLKSEFETYAFFKFIIKQ